MISPLGVHEDQPRAPSLAHRDTQDPTTSMSPLPGGQRCAQTTTSDDEEGTTHANHPPTPTGSTLQGSNSNNSASDTPRGLSSTFSEQLRASQKHNAMAREGDDALYGALSVLAKRVGLLETVMAQVTQVQACQETHEQRIALLESSLTGISDAVRHQAMFQEKLQVRDQAASATTSAISEALLRTDLQNLSQRATDLHDDLSTLRGMVHGLGVKVDATSKDLRDVVETAAQEQALSSSDLKLSVLESAQSLVEDKVLAERRARDEAVDALAGRLDDLEARASARGSISRDDQLEVMEAATPTDPLSGAGSSSTSTSTSTSTSNAATSKALSSLQAKVAECQDQASAAVAEARRAQDELARDRTEVRTALRGNGRDVARVARSVAALASAQAHVSHAVLHPRDAQCAEDLSRAIQEALPQPRTSESPNDATTARGRGEVDELLGLDALSKAAADAVRCSGTGGGDHSIDAGSSLDEILGIVGCVATVLGTAVEERLVLGSAGKKLLPVEPVNGGPTAPQTETTPAASTRAGTADTDSPTPQAQAMRTLAEEVHVLLEVCEALSQEQAASRDQVHQRLKKAQELHSEALRDVTSRLAEAEERIQRAQLQAATTMSAGATEKLEFDVQIALKEVSDFRESLQRVAADTQLCVDGLREKVGWNQMRPIIEGFTRPGQGAKALLTQDQLFVTGGRGGGRGGKSHNHQHSTHCLSCDRSIPDSDQAQAHASGPPNQQQHLRQSPLGRAKLAGETGQPERGLAFDLPDTEGKRTRDTTPLHIRYGNGMDTPLHEVIAEAARGGEARPGDLISDRWTDLQSPRPPEGLASTCNPASAVSEGQNRDRDRDPAGGAGSTQQGQTQRGGQRQRQRPWSASATSNSRSRASTKEVEACRRAAKRERELAKLALIAGAGAGGEARQQQRHDGLLMLNGGTSSNPAFQVTLDQSHLRIPSKGVSARARTTERARADRRSR